MRIDVSVGKLDEEREGEVQELKRGKVEALRLMQVCVYLTGICPLCLSVYEKTLYLYITVQCLLSICHASGCLCVHQCLCDCSFICPPACLCIRSFCWSIYPLVNPLILK